MIVAINKDNNFPVHSSVSGYAVCGTNKLISNGKRINVLLLKMILKKN